PSEHWGVLAEVDRDPVETGADPDDLAGRAELVELPGVVARHAPRQQLRLPEGAGKRQPLQRHERLTKRRAPVDPLPVREEAAEGGLLGGLDLLAQRGERRASQPPQDVGLAPLALGATGPELAA